MMSVAAAPDKRALRKAARRIAPALDLG